MLDTSITEGIGSAAVAATKISRGVAVERGSEGVALAMAAYRDIVLAATGSSELVRARDVEGTVDVAAAGKSRSDRQLAKGIQDAAVQVAAYNPQRLHYDQRELRCLAEGIYFEARGEPLLGQLAVGQVILNRVASKSYPNTICGVVYQNNHMHNRCQFSFACDGVPETIRERKAWYAIRIYAEWLMASNASHRREPEYTILASLAHATHYHADYVNPYWARSLTLQTRIGQHIFYAIPSRSRS